MEKLTEKVGADRMYEINGHRPSASYSIEKLMWIRDHEAEVYQNTYKMLLAKDYIICRLTGKFVTDYSEASGTDAFDLKGMEWSEEVLSAAEIPADKMPELHASTDVIGNLTAHAAEELGLAVNTKVVCGGRRTMFCTGSRKYGEWADVPVVWHLGMDRRNFR